MVRRRRAVVPLRGYDPSGKESSNQDIKRNCHRDFPDYGNQDAREDTLRGPEARKQAERFASAESAVAAITKKIDALAAREQFQACVIKPANVHLDPNSNTKRVTRFPLGTEVKALSRKGTGTRSSMALVMSGGYS